MHDAVQRGALLVVDERLGRQRRPVQRAVGLKNVVAERLDEPAESLGARLNDLTGDDVPIDDDAATVSERVGHCRLAGADTTGQTDTNHRNSLSGRSAQPSTPASSIVGRSSNRLGCGQKETPRLDEPGSCLTWALGAACELLPQCRQLRVAGQRPTRRGLLGA
jgi:hypothetical protein